jgi:hypothetical protein
VSKSAPLTASTPPTPAMASVGLDFSGVLAFARKAVKLIEDHGDEFLDLIEAGFRAFQAVTGRDFAAILTEMNNVNRDLTAIVAAIRAEFNI